MSSGQDKLRRIVWNEMRNLLLGLSVLFILLLVPAGGIEAVLGPKGGIALVLSALRSDGSGDRWFLTQMVEGILRGALPTLVGTALGSLICVGLAVGLVIVQEISGKGRLASGVLSVMSAVPGFLWWVTFVFLGSLTQPAWMFVKAEHAFTTPWRFLAFYGAALFIVAISNGSFMAARQAIDAEMKRLRVEPYVVAARARGVAGWRFYIHHLAIPSVAIVLERLGGILGNCLIAEMLMNIPGMSWQGKQAYGNTGPKYIIVWGLIAIICLIFMRAAHVLGRIAMTRLDPRIGRPAFGADTTS